MPRIIARLHHQKAWRINIQRQQRLPWLWHNYTIIYQTLIGLQMLYALSYTPPLKITRYQTVAEACFQQDYNSENETKRRMHPSIEQTQTQNHTNQQSSPPFASPQTRELLPSVLAHSPPGRSSTLPPLQRRESIKREKPARPRKSSITHNSRKPKHERQRSKDQTRLSMEGRKAFSAEPPGAIAAAVGSRWEDLIEAATSATEAGSDRDATPVGLLFSLLRGYFLIDNHRSLNLRRLSKEPPMPLSPHPIIRLTKLHLYKTRSHPHLPTFSRDQHLFHPSIPRLTLQIRNLQWAVGTISTSPHLVFQTAPTRLHLHSIQAINKFKFTVPGAVD